MLTNQVGDRVCIEYFYPVPVGVSDERESFHGAIIGLFDELNTELLKPITGCRDIRHRDADMAKASRVGIAAMVALKSLV